MKKLLTLLTLALFMVASQTAYAVNSDKVATETTVNADEPIVPNGVEMTKKDKKALKRMRKAIQKMEKKGFNMEEGVDFKDPVDKWMWFWIFGWGIGIVLFIIPIIGWILGPLCILFGTVSLVLWLVKKLG